MKKERLNEIIRNKIAVEISMNPKKSHADIAEFYGVSRQLVTKVAKEYSLQRTATKNVNGAYTYIRNTTINSFSLPWTCSELRTSNKFYLDSLPEKLKYTVNGVNLCFTHGSPNLINEYLFEDAENTKKVMENFEDDVLICAHTHIPFVKKVNDKLIVNVGSIGKPKIGRPNITYAILNIDDAGNVDVTIRELEYEYRRIMKDCIMLNFPSAIVNSYETGQE